ncbi:MAG: extracellular solute-binding protein [Spirochaetota bacterium]
MKRFTVFILAALLLGSAALAGAQARFVVLGHKVHQQVSTGGPGGDIVAEWLKKAGVASVEWQTLGSNNDIRDKLFREATLASTDIQVGFVLNTSLTPAVKEMFEPLDSFLASAPIEDFQDIFPGLREAAKFDGKTYAIPFRHATSALHYNEAFFEERGIKGPPTTIEQLIEYIPKLTFTRADGVPVYGFVIPGKGEMYANTVDLARAWDGDFVSMDYKSVANKYGMVKAITTLADLYKKGFYPKAFTSIANNDLNTWMQQGRVAMTISSTGRNTFYNDPKQSLYPGKIKTIPIPASAEIQSKYPVAPAKTEFWCMVIPKNAKNKAQAWDFIRTLSAKGSTLRAALNGNGPVRASTYNDPSFQKLVPYWKAEKDVLDVARVAMPAFDKATQAADLFNEYAQAAIIGNMKVQEAMDALAKEVAGLLP